MDVPEFAHAPKKHRYTITLGRDVIGYTLYRDEGDQRVFLHTEVEPDYAGHGLATQLIDAAIADSLESKKRIVGVCPTVAKWIERHPEIAEFVDQPA